MYDAPQDQGMCDPNAEAEVNVAQYSQMEALHNRMSNDQEMYLGVEEEEGDKNLIFYAVGRDELAPLWKSYI